VTSGELRLSKEEELNNKLKYNGDLRFILRKSNDKLAFHTIDIDKYQTGDSILIDTDKNKILVYRQNLLTSENEITTSMSGRPF
jgi:hypothetical protein